VAHCFRSFFASELSGFGRPGRRPGTGGGGLAQQFYLLRSGAPAWSGSARAELDRQRAHTVLSHAASEGLDPERYRVDSSGISSASDTAITTVVLTYMRDLAVGRPDLRAIDPDVGLPVRYLDLPALLDKALREDRLAKMLEGLAPQQEGYIALKAALSRGGDKSVLIAANMERWRWLPPVLEPDRIVVNAPDAQLEMWLGGRRVLTSRVIVGRITSPTPILRAEGAGITVNPPWNVPRSIAVTEILPKLKRNHAWLANHDMVLLNGPVGDPHGLHVNWRAIRAGTFPYQIRQYPGPRNPLGQIKLELPNRFDVYLHDTPDKGAFARSTRQLSHGCVRVEQILPLASYALTADTTAMQEITEMIGQGDTRYVPLRRKLPVYFLYWTAVAGLDGELQFHNDVYGRDKRLIAAMHDQPVRVASNAAFCIRG
jgi:murein L,D-transpeptidase YcbB/YkuD